MSWEGYWAPNLIQWIGGGAITALVGAAVGLLARYYLRQFFEQLFGEQQQTRHAAEAAASRSAEAVQQSREAKTSAASADDKSRQITEAVEFLADRLGTVLAENDRMARRNDDMFAANVTMRALLDQHGIPIPDQFNPGGNDTGENGLITITGRHRLHTRLTPTIGQDPT